MSGGVVPDPLATLPVMTLQPAPSGPSPRKGCAARHTAPPLPPPTARHRHTSERQQDNQEPKGWRGGGQVRKKGIALPLSSSVRKSSRKTRSGGEAAWWLLSGITSAGTALQHYRSKPLCLCLSLTTHTRARARSQPTAACTYGTSSCTVGQTGSESTR